MTYKKMLTDIDTAGASFVGTFMGEILFNYPKILEGEKEKTDFIQYMCKEYSNGWGITEDTMKTKCYAVLRIIEGQRVVDALEHVSKCNLKKTDDFSIEDAKRLLEFINNGKVQLPY